MSTLSTQKPTFLCKNKVIMEKLYYFGKILRKQIVFARCHFSKCIKSSIFPFLLKLVASRTSPRSMQFVFLYNSVFSCMQLTSILLNDLIIMVTDTKHQLAARVLICPLSGTSVALPFTCLRDRKVLHILANPQSQHTRLIYFHVYIGMLIF